MEKMEFSVAMATYNGEAHLREQLASLAAQTELPLELVVCDDGSTDATLAILDDFAASAPFAVSIHRNPIRLGYRGNFKRCACLCRGEVLAFSDQDDLWRPEKLAVLHCRFEETGALLLTHDHTIFFEERRAAIPSYFERLRRSGRSPATSLKGCTMACRSSLIELSDLKRAPDCWAHDTWLALSATVLGGRDYVHDVLIDHRIHEKNVSGWVGGGRNKLLPRLTEGILPGGAHTDIEELIEFCVNSENAEAFVAVLERDLAAFVSEKRRHAIIRQMRDKSAIDAFRESDDYRSMTARFRSALGLLFAGRYRTAGHLRGFLQDLLGRRAAE